MMTKADGRAALQLLEEWVAAVDYATRELARHQARRLEERGDPPPEVFAWCGLTGFAHLDLPDTSLLERSRAALAAAAVKP